MNIKEQRTVRGLTQTDCAIACQVSLVTWQSWERGLTTPKPENLQKIKNLFKED